MAGACASDWPRLVRAVRLSSRGARLPAGMHCCTVPCSIPGEADRQHISADLQTLSKATCRVALLHCAFRSINRHQPRNSADWQTLSKLDGVQYDVWVDKAAIADSVTDITIPVWAIELPAVGKWASSWRHVSSHVEACELPCQSKQASIRRHAINQSTNQYV